MFRFIVFKETGMRHRVRRKIKMGAWLSCDFSSLVPHDSAEDDVPSSVSPLRMSIALRRKLGRGVHHNVKLLLRGDLGTGKSALLRRLQGLAALLAVGVAVPCG